MSNTLHSKYHDHISREICKQGGLRLGARFKIIDFSKYGMLFNHIAVADYYNVKLSEKHNYSDYNKNISEFIRKVSENQRE